MDERRYCNKANFFCADGSDDAAHALKLRGKYIMQAVPCHKKVGGSAGRRWLIISIFGAIFFGFVGVQVWRVITPPKLTIAYPPEGQATENHQIIINGSTEPEAEVEINGQQVASNPAGQFTQPIELQPGTNKIFIRSTKKHGLFTTVSRTVMLNTPTNTAQPIAIPVSVLPSNSVGPLN